MAEVLRTDDVTQADRFAQWRHWISATFVPLECAPVSREPFRGEVAHWELGGLLVSRVAARPHLASRTRRMIALRDVGYYKVGLLTRGSCRLSQEGREALLQPGDLAIYDCRRPYTMMFDEPHEMSSLMFPCDRLRLPPAAVEQVLVTPVSSARARARWSPRSCGGWWPTWSSPVSRSTAGWRITCSTWWPRCSANAPGCCPRTRPRCGGHCC
jgi:hypothetical protein